MSKPRGDWWVSVKAAVRAYPGRKKQLEELLKAVSPRAGKGVRAWNIIKNG